MLVTFHFLSNILALVLWQEVEEMIHCCPNLWHICGWHKSMWHMWKSQIDQCSDCEVTKVIINQSWAKSLLQLPYTMNPVQKCLNSAMFKFRRSLLLAALREFLNGEVAGEYFKCHVWYLLILKHNCQICHLNPAFICFSASLPFTLGGKKLFGRREGGTPKYFVLVRDNTSRTPDQR